MKLRPDYETVRSNLMSRAALPILDDCLQELLREEQRQSTKATLEQKVFDAVVPVAYVAKNRSSTQGMSKIQCFSCKNYDHYAH